MPSRYSVLSEHRPDVRRAGLETALEMAVGNLHPVLAARLLEVSSRGGCRGPCKPRPVGGQGHVLGPDAGQVDLTSQPSRVR